MRLFVALSLPEMVRTHLSLLGGGVPGANWSPAENLHLTLRFIGEVDGGTMRTQALYDGKSNAFGSTRNSVVATL